MNGTRKSVSRGMVLVEAMVALVVLAIGILGVAKLSSYFIEVSGQTKARAQAVQLAESKLAELRSLMVKDPQFDDEIANGSDSVYGYSADGVQSTQFTRSWAVALNGTESKEIAVNVAWGDRFGATQSVVVNSVVAWNSPGAAAGLLALDESGGPGKYAKPPTGRAKLGEGTMPIPPGATPGSDGLYNLQGDDGKWRLVDANGNVLLTATERDEPFSQIAGNVYISQASLNGISNDDVYIVISDASFCSMVPAKGTNPENALSNLGTGSVFKYFSYRCHLGANWYGNIGVVRVDNANTNDRVCVGDPAVAALPTSTKSDNRHPALSTTRMYRGYHASGASFLSTGIGINASGDYVAATYDGHDFLLTRITGNPTDADCLGKLDDYDSTAPHQPFGTCATVGGCSGQIFDALTHTNSGSLPATETAYLNGENTIKLGNPGKFFCLTQTCPDPLPNAAPTQITITVTGTIAKSPDTGSYKPVISMTTSSGTCSGDALTSWLNNGETYSCSFTGEGFTGGTWSGTMTVSLVSDGPIYICNTGVSGPAAGPSSPAVNTYTFDFVNQPVDAGNTTQSFKIAQNAAGC